MIYDKTIRRYVYFRDGGRCFYCGRRLSLRQFTLDHFLPRAAGGKSEVFNLVACCKGCNREKGSALPEDVEKLMAELFARAVEDGFVRGNGVEKLRGRLYSIEKTEVLGAVTVFEGRGFRVYAGGNRIIKVVLMGDGRDGA